jgi:RNA polymerase sigma-70 factor, ECF subfamily
MTRSSRQRRRDVLELVDAPARTEEVTGATRRGTGAATGVPLPLPEGPASAPPPESFEDFYRREYPHLLVLARALAGDLVAEDVAQESMLVAYRQWSRVSALGSPTGYVRGICAHQAVSWVRRRVSERRAVRRLASRRVSQVAALSADGEQFWAAVRRLPHRQAQVTALFYALDLPVAEIAETLGCAEGTVKVHLSRARAQLAARLGTTEEQP